MKLVQRKYNCFHSVVCLLGLVIIPVLILSFANGSKIDLNDGYSNLDKFIYEVKGINAEDVSFSSHSLQKRSVSVNTTTVNKNETVNETSTATPVSISDVNPAVTNVKNITTIETTSNTTDANNSLYNTEIDDAELPVNYNKSAKFDHHKYYRSYYKTGEENVNQYWVDMHSLPKDEKFSHESLSNAYRRALTVTLTFDFPFYGHYLRNVTIATGGFLFTGSFLHKWLAATQYIAPLMANFDTSKSTDASVIYADNGTSLTVQWDKVVLQDDPTAGTFTFQVTIHQSGNIVFAYKDIPCTVTLIEDHEHPVKVGLSDAYIVEKKIFYVRKKTIYEYHKIDIKEGMQIGNWTAIIFEPLPICISLNTCDACLTSNTSFMCKWCPQVGRCSDGYDRHRQDWIEWQCENSAVSNQSVCSQLPLPNTFPTSNVPVGASTDSLVNEAKSGHSNLWVGLLMGLVVVAVICGWVTYAYLHPHTPSGQILIKYRPSAWSLRRGEARYTAATMHSIHM